MAVDGQGAHFALPNAAHREQCAEQQAEVEKALSDHFGTKVTLVLDIDDTVPRRQRVPARPRRRPPGLPVPHRRLPWHRRKRSTTSTRVSMEDTSTDQASAAEARLLQAFPGASEVAE